ncbi:MAG: hypothetical protein AAF721_35755 [Myxococcota bacterium]
MDRTYARGGGVSVYHGGSDGEPLPGDDDDSEGSGRARARDSAGARDSTMGRLAW